MRWVRLGPVEPATEALAGQRRAESTLLGAAKVGDTRVGADARAHEGDNMLALDDPSSYCLDVLLEALFVGHGACRKCSFVRLAQILSATPEEKGCGGKYRCDVVE